MLRPYFRSAKVTVAKATQQKTQQKLSWKVKSFIECKKTATVNLCRRIPRWCWTDQWRWLIRCSTTKHKHVCVWTSTRSYQPHSAIHDERSAQPSMGHPSQSYRASPATWDHTATQNRWTCPTLSPARQAGTRFTYPGGMEGWVDLGVVTTWPDRELNPPPLNHKSDILPLHYKYDNN